MDDEDLMERKGLKRGEDPRCTKFPEDVCEDVYFRSETEK